MCELMRTDHILATILTVALSVVSQLVRFYSHMICPHQLIEPDAPLLLAEAGLRFLGCTTNGLFVAVEKWESRLGGISKGRWSVRVDGVRGERRGAGISHRVRVYFILSTSFCR